MYTTKIGRAVPADWAFSQLPPLPILSYFINWHIHWNCPPCQRICDEYTKSPQCWQHSGMGASLVRATAASKLQALNSQRRKTTHEHQKTQQSTRWWGDFHFCQQKSPYATSEVFLPTTNNTCPVTETPPTSLQHGMTWEGPSGVLIGHKNS